MRNIVLFDLDGTLTPARGSMTPQNESAIMELLGVARVGIVTGSNLDYVKQQVPHHLFVDGLEVFPCNGTQHWIYAHDKWKQLHPFFSMKETLGATTYRRLVYDLLSLQRNFMNKHPLEVTGTFISYRESLLNWCPIGRDAGPTERATFEEFDSKSGWRNQTLKEVRSLVEGYACKPKIEVKLGGVTSFDIFPEGWNKTFVLNRIGNDTPWFVGDRCEGDGNDREIYEKLLPTGKAFSVNHHDETPAIINEMIKALKKA